MSYDAWDDSLEEDRKSGRRSSGKKWGYLFRFTDAPTKIHLSHPENPYTHPKTGKELPFRAGKRHYLPGRGKRKKGMFAECGVDAGEPCVVCAYSNPAAFDLENVAPDASLAQHEAKVYYAVAGWIEEDYHLVEYYKDDNDHDKGTYTQRERCLGRGCEYCLDDLPKVFGKKFYTEISPGQWRHSIHDLHKKIENRYCKCGGDIYVTSFTCGGCDKLVLDVCTTCDCGSDDVSIDVDKGEATCGSCNSVWSAFYTDHQKLYEESSEVYKCKCGHRGFLVPQRICGTEGCEVDPYGVFDCQLTVRTTGTKKEKRLIIDEYVIQEPDERLFDEEYQGADDWAPKIVEAFKKPLDLEYLLRPASTAEQAKEIGKPDPFSTAAKGSARYARYEGEDGESDDEALTA